MTCREYSVDIAEFMDGALDAARRRELERHVEGCERCRALVADLKSIQAAAFTLERLDPPPAVWQAIRDRLPAASAPAAATGLRPWAPTRTAWGVWLAAAAALVVATAASLYPLLTDRGAPPEAGGAPPGHDVVASVHADLQVAEEHYDKAIQGLEQIARSDGGELDPQVAAVLQKNLQVIDQAIGESRAALKSQPASVNAQESLFDAMRTKVALLQQTIELINEMRKGNQAEAGRLIQGLQP